jgi:xanthine dehydrogenase YagS FAD-binding subunit
MEAFTYVRTNDAAAAIKEVGREPHARFLAGGTNLVDYMKLNVETPTRLVDINHLAPLDRVEVTDTTVRIGALVRNSTLAYDEKVRKCFPMLSEALLAGATPQIRNRATVGGNLLQRTRCMYFRDTAWPCNKRAPGSGCAALDGYNRYHAVLGTSEKCIATHPSDMTVALTALDAVITIRGPRGESRIPIIDFYIAYGDDPVRESVLQHGELITSVEVPVKPWFARSHYLKVRDRASFEFALASAAVAVEIKNGKIATARVALGGVATKPWRAVAAEKVLNGAKPETAAYAAAAEAALTGATPQKFNAFKIELAKRVIHKHHCQGQAHANRHVRRRASAGRSCGHDTQECSANTRLGRGVGHAQSRCRPAAAAAP